MLEITTEKEGNFYIIKLKGDVDANASIHLDNAIRKAISGFQKNLLVDCSKLDYISSAGIGVFIAYLEDFQKNAINLVLFGMKAQVKRFFEILGLEKFIQITDTKEHAKAIHHRKQ